MKTNRCTLKYVLGSSHPLGLGVTLRFEPRLPSPWVSERSIDSLCRTAHGVQDHPNKTGPVGFTALRFSSSEEVIGAFVNVCSCQFY